MADRADLTLGTVTEISEAQWQELIDHPGQRR